MQKQKLSVLSATVQNGTILLRCENTPIISEWIGSLPKVRWNSKELCQQCEATPAAAWRILQCEFAKVEACCGVYELAEQFYFPPTPPDSWRQPELRNADDWLHQVGAYEYIGCRHSALLDMKMGCGKTKPTVELISNTGAKRSLILCPTNVRGVWRRELKKWAATPIDVLVLDKKSWNTKRQAQESEKFLRRCEGRGVAAVIVQNYESACYGLGGRNEREKFCGWSLKQDWDIVVCDESHRIGTHTTNVSKYADKLRPRSKKRICLTGSPIDDDPLNIFGQARFIDPGVFGTSFVRFRNRYATTKIQQVINEAAKLLGMDCENVTPALPAVKSELWKQQSECDPQDFVAQEKLDSVKRRLGYAEANKTAKWVVSYKNQDELARLMGLFTYKVGNEVLDLPEITHQDVTGELSRKSRQVYDAMERDCIADVQDGVITASNGLVKLLRLQQITGGFCPIDDTEEIESIGTEKQEMLAALLEDMPAREPVVVFCRFTEDLRRVRAVAEKLKRSYGEISGQRKDLTPQATMPEGIDLMGVQIKSGGVGIDLTRACYGVYYSIGYSLTDYLQSIARLHRPGQDRPTFFYHLVLQATMDQVVYGALQAKEDLMQSVMESLKKSQKKA